MPSLRDARRIVDRWTRRGIAWIYGQGFDWIHRVFTPCVRVLEQHGRPSDRLLASEGRYYLGDVHDFNGAPLAAIREYRRAVRNWPGQGAAWREIGSMQERIGLLSAALRSVRKAVRIDPQDQCAIGDLKALEEANKHPPGKCLYLRSDPLWRARELIDAGRPHAALRLLRDRRDTRSRQVRARAHGRLGDAASFASEWTAIASGRGPVTLESPDHFYLPTALCHDPRWWELLWRLRRRVANGHWNLPESFFSHAVWWRRATRLGRIELHLRYNLARTRRDTTALSAIVRRHPWFTEARRELRRLRHSRR